MPVYNNLSRIHHASTPGGCPGETGLMDGRVLRNGPPHAEVLAAAVADVDALKRVAKDCSAPSTQVLGRQLIREAESLLEKIRRFTPDAASQIDAYAADIGAMPRKLAAALQKDQQESRVVARGGQPMFLKNGRVVSSSARPDMLLLNSSCRFVRGGVGTSSESDSSSGSDWSSDSD